jgi:hypothetical protein
MSDDDSEVGEDAEPDERPGVEARIGQRRRAWKVRLASAFVVLAGAGFGVWYGLFRSSPSPAQQQLTTAWTAFRFAPAWNGLTTAVSSTSAHEAGRAATAFATAVGRISFPAAYEADAHDVIRDAITLVEDFAMAAYSPPTAGTSCSPTSVCLPLPAAPGGLIYPASLHSDLSAFDQNVRVLFADFGATVPR